MMKECLIVVFILAGLLESVCSQSENHNNHNNDRGHVDDNGGPNATVTPIEFSLNTMEERIAVDGGECQKYDDTSAGICEGYAFKYVWEFEGSTKPEQESRLTPMFENIRNISKWYFAEFPDKPKPVECFDAWRSTLCHAALPPCFIDSNYEEAPQKLCRGTCEKVYDVCRPVISLLKEHQPEIVSSLFPGSCDDDFFDSGTDTYLYLEYHKDWETYAMFDDDDAWVSTSAGHEATVPCFGQRSDRKFWDVYTYSDDENDETDGDFSSFEKRCAEFGGTFLIMTDPAGEQYPECTITDKKKCVEAGGEWLVSGEGYYGQNGEELLFECFLPNTNQGYEYVSHDEPSLDDPTHSSWLAPKLDIDESVSRLGENTFVLPFNFRIIGEDGADILFSRGMTNIDDPCEDERECIPAPSYANYQAGTVKMYPPGKHMSILDPGYLYISMRAVGRGKDSSRDTFLELKLVHQDALERPSADSNLAYVRFEILMPFGDPALVDAVLLRSVLMFTLNEELDLNLKLEDVILRKLTEQAALFEIRVLYHLEAILAEHLKNKLFLYPLGETLYDYGFFPNATNACEASASLQFNQTAFQVLEPLQILAGNKALLGGILGTLAFLLLLSLCYIRRRLGLARAHEKRNVAKESAINAKAEDLSQREKELGDKVNAVEEQEKALLEEKQGLAEEQDKLKEQEAIAEQEVERLDMEELKLLDPQAHEAIMLEEEDFDIDLVQNAVSTLDTIKTDFADAGPSVEEDIEAEKKSILDLKANNNLRALVRIKTPRRETSYVGQDLKRLEAFADMIHSNTDKAEFLAFTKELVEKGAIRETSLNEEQRLKQEYEDAFSKYRTDIRRKKQKQMEKLKQRRKRRIELIVQDAKPSQQSDGVAELLEKEIQRENDLSFDREFARIKKEMPSKEAFDEALADLERRKIDARSNLAQNVEARRAKAKQALQVSQAKIEQERKAAEERASHLAVKVTNVFKKISSVDHKVKNLKQEHETFQAQLDEQKRLEKQRQREKLQKRRATKAKSNQVAPAKGVRAYT